MRKSVIQDIEIGQPQRPLFAPERTRASVTNIDRCRTHVSKSSLARPQAQIDIFEITALKGFRQVAHRVEAGPRDIKAESRSVEYVSRRGFFGPCGEGVEPHHRVARAE